ncbi:MAG: exo-alpha-sialidase, partial [Ignavibacteria bacterium]|nr:exo-alpha-sialidase [Ignavibacteria bacterium]
MFTTWASSVPNSPYTEDYIGLSKSTNGGVDWTVNENAIDINGIRTTQLAPWTIRANSFPVIDIDKTGGSRNGWIYIATTSKNLAPAGNDPDIIMFRSTDDGNSWSSGVRVNQDPINNGRNQFFPSIKVDENGGLNIVYYDNRNSVDSADVYLSRSTDGGSSWSDHRVTTQRFKPRSVAGAGGGNMGDNLGLTSGNGKLYPVWMSNQPSDIFQIWSAIIDYTTIGITQTGTEIPKHYSLEQNYPNP